MVATRTAQPWLFPGNIPGRHISTDAVEHACQEAHRLCRIAKPITPHSLRRASAYYTTFQSVFILKKIGAGQAQLVAVYGQHGLLALGAAPQGDRGPFD